MKPERGDKSIKVGREDVTRAVASVGVCRGDTVMFHSSLSSMGHVIGGADAVIDGFLDAVGPEGTVCVPSLCRYPDHLRGRAREIWDPMTTPSYVGRIPEVFRRRPDAVRSNHFTHAVAAIGARAEELTRDHGLLDGRPGPWGDRAFAEESPWDKFYQWNAAYCFIGVDFTVNTMRHYIESLIVEDALRSAAPGRRPDLEGRLTGWMKEGVWPRHDGRQMGERLARMGLVRFGKIGSATLRCIRTRDMVDNALRILRAEPELWFTPEFLEWQREARG